VGSELLLERNSKARKQECAAADHNLKILFTFRDNLGGSAQGRRSRGRAGGCKRVEDDRICKKQKNRYQLCMFRFSKMLTSEITEKTS